MERLLCRGSCLHWDFGAGSGGRRKAHGEDGAVDPWVEETQTGTSARFSDAGEVYHLKESGAIKAAFDQVRGIICFLLPLAQLPLQLLEFRI